MFKCSKDSGALYHGFQITLRNVFDIQVLLEKPKYYIIKVIKKHTKHV